MKNHFLFILSLLLFFSCNEKEGGKPSPRTNDITLSPLNETNQVTLKKRITDADKSNYQEACWYLNASFKKRNICTMLLQNNFFLDASQKAEFTKLPSGSSFTDYSIEDGSRYGDYLKSNELAEGDFWYFENETDDAQYSLIFKINRITKEEIKLEYQIKEFKLLW